MCGSKEFHRGLKCSQGKKKTHSWEEHISQRLFQRLCVNNTKQKGARIWLERSLNKWSQVKLFLVFICWHSSFLISLLAYLFLRCECALHYSYPLGTERSNPWHVSWFWDPSRLLSMTVSSPPLQWRLPNVSVTPRDEVCWLIPSPHSHPSKSQCSIKQLSSIYSPTSPEGDLAHHFEYIDEPCLD